MAKNLVFMGSFRAIALLVAVICAPLSASAADGLPPIADILSERVLGKAEAPVTLIEYASLTCPHCANFAVETMPTIKRDYVETGKVKLIYRDFPLDRLALTAGMMARCAPEDRYYGLIETLFKTQGTWTRAADPGAALQRLGALAGLSKENFDSCIANKEVFDGMVALRAKAQQEHKVDSTPTFILDGRKLTGDLSLPEVRKALDAAIAAKS